MRSGIDTRRGRPERGGVRSPMPSWDALRCSAVETLRSDIAGRVGSSAAGRVVSRLSSRCIRSCWPFSWGLAGVIRWWTMPSCIHQTFRGDRPWMPVEANGAPLSVRIASGKPTSRKSARNTGLRERRLHRAESPTHQQAAAEMIGHRQRIAVLAIARLELPFEVGRPHLIRVVASAPGRPRVRPPARRRFFRSRLWRSRIVVDGLRPATTRSGAASGAPAGASSLPSRTPGAPPR